MRKTSITRVEQNTVVSTTSQRLTRVKHGQYQGTPVVNVSYDINGRMVETLTNGSSNTITNPNEVPLGDRDVGKVLMINRTGDMTWVQTPQLIGFATFKPETKTISDPSEYSYIGTQSGVRVSKDSTQGAYRLTVDETQISTDTQISVDGDPYGSSSGQYEWRIVEHLVKQGEVGDVWSAPKRWSSDD